MVVILVVQVPVMVNNYSRHGGRGEMNIAVGCGSSASGEQRVESLGGSSGAGASALAVKVGVSPVTIVSWARTPNGHPITVVPRILTLLTLAAAAETSGPAAGSARSVAAPLPEKLAYPARGITRRRLDKCFYDTAIANLTGRCHLRMALRKPRDRQLSPPTHSIFSNGVRRRLGFWPSRAVPICPIRIGCHRNKKGNLICRTPQSILRR
jgi:hypothetical protein